MNTHPNKEGNPPARMNRPKNGECALGSIPHRGERLPQRATQPVPEIIAQKGPKPLIVQCLSQTFVGVQQHFAGMSLPHVSGTYCWACEELQQLPRWQGYLACYSPAHRDRRVLTFPEGAGRQLLQLLARHGTLRGSRLKLYRRNPDKPNSPLLVGLEEISQADDVPPDFDPFPSIAKLFMVNEGYYKSDGYRAREKPSQFIQSQIEMPTGPVNVLDFFNPRRHDQ